MTSTSSLPSPAAEPTTADPAVVAPAHGALLRLLPETTVGVLAALFFSWRVGAPSPWWDEAVTRDVISRPTGAILELAERVDLVHLAYYLLVHGLLGPDASFTSIRMLSVLAAGVTCGLLVAVGRVLGSLRTGVVAGALFAAAPLAARYAQEARPYALVIMLGAATTLALLHALRAPQRRSGWLRYAVLLGLCGVVNVLSLLLLAVHGAHVLALGRGRRPWLVAAGTVGLLLSPFAVALSTQSGQVAWLVRPDLAELGLFYRLVYDGWWPMLTVLGLAVLGALLPRVRVHRPALLLGLLWAVLPPVLLWLASQVHPLFDTRYVLVSVPGVALALASLAGALRPVGLWRPVVLAAPVLALAWAGSHMQLVYRNPVLGHSEDLRTAAQTIATRARPGDAVLFLPSSRRIVELAYPAAFARTDDIALAHSPSASATLFGVEEPAADLAADIDARSRVWLVTGPLRAGEVLSESDRLKAKLLGRTDLQLVSTTLARRYTVLLFER